MDCKQFFSKLKGKKIAMLGIGVSHTPLIFNFLKQGARVIACDKRDRAQLGPIAAELEAAGAELKLGEGYLNDLEADMIFRTPGMNFHLPELEAARKRGMLISGGEVDTERMSKVLLDEFRGGKLGRFTLERPEDL